MLLFEKFNPDPLNDTLVLRSGVTKCYKKMNKVILKRIKTCKAALFAFSPWFIHYLMLPIEKIN